MNLEGTEIYNHHVQNRKLVGSCCIAQGAQPGALYDLDGWEQVGGGQEVQEGVDKCILMADSC